MIKWHRRLGLTALVFILLLSISGIVLNHTDELGLDERPVTAGWLLDWYGIEAPPLSVSYPIGNRWLSQIDEALYLGDQKIGALQSPLIGLAATGELITLASANEIQLYTYGGEAIEQLTNGLPGHLKSIGKTKAGEFAVLADNQFYVADDLLTRWTPENIELHMTVPGQPPAELSQKIREDYRASLLNLERLMLDLHNGRLFTKAGPWVFDVIGLILIFMALSGLWMWRRAPQAWPSKH